jgi:pyruvate kinase
MNTAILAELNAIYDSMLKAEADKKHLTEAAKLANHQSAVNLVDYLALRSKNIEPLQEKLHALGLSSLASSESHIKAQLGQIMQRLGHEAMENNGVDAETGVKILHQHIISLLGKTGKHDAPPIMVTFDTNFSKDVQLLVELLENGMRVARINCAHDDAAVWLDMVACLEQAKVQTGLPCKLYMDIAGPKIRTQVISKKDGHGKLKVETGQEIFLVEPGMKAPKDGKYICCTLPGIIANLKEGQRVLMDDGLFEAVVQSVHDKVATLKLTRISAVKPVIKSEKGLNFPDTKFKVNPITEYDLQCLPFILEHADMLGFSFVNNAADLQLLQKHLDLLDHPGFPVVAKIETGLAVSNLPEILLQGLQQPQFGVMVARGDLAIEIGFERMSEIQDEILWLCEAAHVPVIWATQVLENMNKQGIATKGEITDAVHAASADCVMLNKGDHIVEVMRTLSDILRRSRKNSLKNRRIFRKLSIAEHFLHDQ